MLTKITFSGSPFKSYLSEPGSESGIRHNNVSQHIYSEPHQHQVKELQHYSVRRVTGSREEYKADMKGKNNNNNNTRKVHYSNIKVK